VYETIKSEVTFQGAELSQPQEKKHHKKEPSENKTKSNNLKSLKHYRIFLDIPHHDEKLIRAFFKKYQAKWKLLS